VPVGVENGLLLMSDGSLFVLDGAFFEYFDGSEVHDFESFADIVDKGGPWP